MTALTAAVQTAHPTFDVLKHVVRYDGYNDSYEADYLLRSRENSAFYFEVRCRRAIQGDIDPIGYWAGVRTEFPGDGSPEAAAFMAAFVAQHRAVPMVPEAFNRPSAGGTVEVFGAQLSRWEHPQDNAPWDLNEWWALSGSGSGASWLLSSGR